MSEDIELKDRPTDFDFRGFLLKLISYWYLFVISILIGVGIAYYINIRKLPIYKMESIINIKDDSNPLFTDNTSLTFNWGGVSEKLNTAKIKLQSRTHNEKVVDRLQLYVQYLKKGEYQKVDAYGKVPFKISNLQNKYQLIGHIFEVKKIQKNQFELSWQTNDAVSGDKMNYTSLNKKAFSTNQPVDFKKTYQFGDPVNTDFLSITINEKENWPIGKSYFFSFKDYYSVVKNFQNVEVNANKKGSSVLTLQKTGNNRHKLVDYLNTTSKVLSENMLKRKNLFATNTIRFIDSILRQRKRELNQVEIELEKFKKNNQILDLSAESEQLNQRLIRLDKQEQEEERKLSYYNQLQEYLNQKDDYSEVPAPSVAAIDENSIQKGVSEIVELSQQRNAFRYSMKESAPRFDDIDRQINATKSVLLENIRSSKKQINKELTKLRERIKVVEKGIRELPQEQQELLKIERRYEMREATYNVFISKRDEASLIKAANVSDVEVIEDAKITGNPPIGPNKHLNYVMGCIIGGFIPFLLLFTQELFDNKIKNPDDVTKLSMLNIISIIGKSNVSGNIVVLKKPRSIVSETFRGLRTSLQFTFKNQDKENTSRCILITSSISGEGKTFTAINLASVFSLSDKKTLIIGLDLRKPKIFDDFDLHNEIGAVDYLEGESNVTDIIQKTDYKNLDVITSGKIPPNPSEILMGEKIDQLIAELKTKYDYIIMDTPPIGLVADGINLMKFADASLYMIRQDYTKKGMLNIINEKYKRGEVENISFVLNYFRQKAKYGYSYNYGYGYSYGYGKYGDAYIEKENKFNFFKKIFKS